MRHSVSQLVARAAQCQPSNLRNLPTALEAELTALAGSPVKSKMGGVCMKRLQELSGLSGFRGTSFLVLVSLKTS